MASEPPELTPELFVAIGRMFPACRTIGDLFATIDDAAHRAEDAGRWDDAATLRTLQGQALRLLDRMIAAGRIDVTAAVAVTIARGG